MRARPEIYDNVNVNFRTKINKEKAWTEISNILQQDIIHLKKLWKNLRDRYVKVRNARERHFAAGNDVNTVPTYCFYEQLDFIKNFSSKKEDQSSLLAVNMTEPEQSSLEFNGEEYFDYTTQFLEEVKKHPILFDPSLKNDPTFNYNTSKAWKEIAESLNNKFSRSTLKIYWTSLVQKYTSRDSDEENPIFELMHFFEPYLCLRNEELEQSVNMIVPEFLDYDSSNEELDNERLEYMISDGGESIGLQRFKRSPESSIIVSEPEPCIKRAKTTSYEELPESSLIPTTTCTRNDSQEDEFDYFGKKVAFQLRSIALRNKKEARMCEIRCLQILMESEEK